MGCASGSLSWIRSMAKGVKFSARSAMLVKARSGESEIGNSVIGEPNPCDVRSLGKGQRFVDVGCGPLLSKDLS